MGNQIYKQIGKTKQKTIYKKTKKKLTKFTNNHFVT